MSRHSGRARVAALTVLTAGLVVPPPADAGTDGWMIARTGSAPRRLTATVTMTAQAEAATVVVVGLTGSGKKREPVEGSFDVELGTDAYPRAYQDGLLADCPAAAACTAIPVGQTDTRELDTERPVAATFYIAALGATTRVTNLAAGWTIRPARLDLRAIRGEHGTGTGVRVLRTPIEHFTHAQLSGGPYGSLALAALPCGYGPVRGTGSARLTGDGRSHQLDCAGGPVSIGAHTPGPTTWTLAGDATGVGFHANRLVVFNYPRS